MNKEYTLQQFTNHVTNYIDAEYGDSNDLITMQLSDDEKYTIKNILEAQYHAYDSPNNTANYIIHYLRESRNWAKDHN